MFILVAIVAGNVYLWNYYSLALKNNYDLGFLSGKELGYQVGLTEGNQSGYQTGYSEGNYSGYTFGYDHGIETGYNLGFYYGNISGYEKGFLDGNETGFALGYIQHAKDAIGRSYNITDPTYQEMLNFIASDETNENQYSENYTCLHFTADVKNNAFNAGIRSGFVYIEFPDTAHAIVCFNTTDHGLIFIEPQFDDIVALNIGQSYSALNGYEEPTYNDTILGYLMIW
jgi:hypothetical protein